MNNNPENEKKEMENKVETNDDFFSTVFSDPTEHKKAPKRKNRRLLKAIASVLSVAVLIAGTVLIIKLIPKKDEINNPSGADISDNTNSNTNKEPSVLSETVITEFSGDDLSQVAVKNESGSFVLCSGEEKNETTGDKETVWYLKGIDKSLVNSSTASYFAGDAASFSSLREITEKTSEECGLNKPYATVEVTKKDSKNYTITVGAKAPANSGYYVKYSENDKIYLVDTSYVDSLNVDKLYFASSDGLKGFELPTQDQDYISQEGQLINFDSLTIKSSKFSDTLVIESNPNEALAQYIGFLVTKPTRRIAENVDGLISLFSNGVSAEGAYAYDVKADTLKKYGLDKPDFQITMEIKGKTLTYKFSLQEDGSYAAICDSSKLVSKIAADSIKQYAEEEIIHFYSSWICLYSIDDITELNLTVNGKDYNFGIRPLSEEEAANSDVNYAITLNGKSIDCQNFQTFYQHLISVPCTDYVVDKAEEDPQITFEFVFKDKKAGKSVIKFTKASATRYAYSVDGMKLGKANSSDINRLIKNLEKLSKGETVPTPN